MKKYTSLFYFLACMFSANAQVADKITVLNNDLTGNPPPSSFSQEVRFHNKWNSSIGVPHVGSPGIGTYSALMTIAPWSDATGPKHHQLNFNEEGLYWRKGLIGSSWGAWRKIITSDQNGKVAFGTITSSLSSNGITLGYDQNTLEFVNSDYGSGYGAKIYGFDQGNGLTSLRFAVRGNSSTWTDAVYIRAADNSAGKLGYTGIGTNDPTARVHIHEPVPLGETAGNHQILMTVGGRGSNYFNNNLWLYRDTNGSQWWYTRLHDGISIDGSYLTPGVDTRTWWERDPMDNIQSWGHANQTYMTLKNGALGIGTADPDASLTVKGDIHTREVKVDLNGAVGPDYVFEKDYDLLSLTELETYINQNKHLPEVPSAKDMEENGLNLKEMNLLLLKKVEELTLHLIEMKKEMEVMKQKLDLQVK